MENKNIIRVVAATLDKQTLTLYKEDGETVVLPQGDTRLKRIVEQVMPVVLNGGIAEIDLGEDIVNSFEGFEKKSGGLIRFFKVAKSKLASLFTSEPKKDEEEVTVAVMENITMEEVEIVQDAPATNTYPQPVPVVAPVTKAVEVAAAVNDVLTHLEPLTVEDSIKLKEEDTVVAVVNGQAIAGAESLKPHLHRIEVDNSSPVGVQKFLERLAAVIQKRRHSVDDLMAFLKKGDLPITDDGCLLAYKVLNRDHGNPEIFVDCHTGKVHQKVGSFVHMDEALVDPNRRNECSNGLHIARRDYISNFGGSVCVLVKIKPEDVIAVPEDYGRSKMRVCGYHILSQVSDEEFRLLKNNRPFTEQQSARKQLAAALRGDHIGITQYVKITEQRGGGVLITDATPEAKTTVAAAEETPAVVDEVTALNTDENAVSIAPPVDPVQVAEQVAGAKGSRQQQAQELLKSIKEAQTPGDKSVYAHKLVALKKTAKVNWDRLGISEKEAQRVLKLVETKPAPAKTKATEQVAKDDTAELLFLDPTEIEDGKHDTQVRHWVEIKRKRKKAWPLLGVNDITGKAMLSRFGQMNLK